MSRIQSFKKEPGVNSRLKESRPGITLTANKMLKYHNLHRFCLLDCRADAAKPQLYSRSTHVLYLAFIKKGKL